MGPGVSRKLLGKGQSFARVRAGVAARGFRFWTSHTCDRVQSRASAREGTCFCMSRDAAQRARPFCLRLDLWIHFLTKRTSSVTNQPHSEVRCPEPPKAEMLIGIRKSWADFEIERCVLRVECLLSHRLEYRLDRNRRTGTKLAIRKTVSHFPRHSHGNPCRRRDCDRWTAHWAW